MFADQYWVNNFGHVDLLEQMTYRFDDIRGTQRTGLDGPRRNVIQHRQQLLGDQVGGEDFDSVTPSVFCTVSKLTTDMP